MATTDVYSICGSLTPTKPALRFRANAADGVQVDAAIAAIVTANHTIGTFSAWIMVPNNTGTYTIFGAGNSATVEYMTISVKAGLIQALIIDTGPSTRIDVSTPANSIKPNTWHHVAVVQDAVCMKIYIDGILQTLTWATSTEITQWFDDLDTINGGHIGAADSVAGGAALSQEFKGYISDVRIWSGTTSASALTEKQVGQVMSGQTVGAAYEWWTLDRSVVSKGSNATTGTIAGALIYVDANEFSSKLTFTAYTLIAATNVSLCMSNGTAMALFVPSA